MLKAYFENGILTERAEAVTPGFVVAFSKGLLRYTGDSIVQKTGMERPLSILLTAEKTDALKVVLGYFKDALFELGVEAAENLEKFDVKIDLKGEKDLKIEVFDVFSGKLLPIPQIAANYIEHSLNTDTGLEL
jgi:hypothetical protein